MSNTEGDFLKSVSNWINSQGYPLEIKVANAFRRNDFGTVVSTWYTDYETKALREIDVIATTYHGYKKNSLLLQVDWHISCKTSTEKPWVVFLSEREGTPNFPFASICSPALQEYLRTKTDMLLWNEVFKDEPLLIPEKWGHGVVQAFSTVDLPYQAIMSAIKSCVNSIQTPEGVLDTKSRRKVATLWSLSIPVVVVNTRLFECFIDRQDREHISEVKSTCVAGRKIVYDNYLALPLVHIVTASEIDNFAHKAMQTTQKIFRALIK